MRIRLAVREDAAAISRLVGPLTDRYVLHEFTPEAREHFRSTVSVEAIDGCLEAGYRYHVAAAGEALLGVVATRDDGHLYHRFVAESAQGRGLARRLWEVARDASRAAGHTGDFTVRSSRHAVGLYEKLGFVRDGPDEEDHGIVSVPMRLRADCAPALADRREKE